VASFTQLALWTKRLLLLRLPAAMSDLAGSSALLEAGTCAKTPRRSPAMIVESDGAPLGGLVVEGLGVPPVIRARQELLRLFVGQFAFALYVLSLYKSGYSCLAQAGQMV
jgi:hypothetical protein